MEKIVTLTTKLKHNRRRLLKNKTESELLFEAFLRSESSKRRLGLPFETQKTIGFYIVDFFFGKRNLIVELDGEIHNLPDVKIYDDKRSLFFQRLGLNIIRFSNEFSREKPVECFEKIISFPTVKFSETSKKCIMAARIRNGCRFTSKVGV